MVDRTDRPIAPLQWSDPTEHRRRIAVRANSCLPKDGSEGMTRPLRLAAYAIADLPDAEDWTYGMVYVTDDVGGAVPAFSDGTNWRRVTDRAAVSTT